MDKYQRYKDQVKAFSASPDHQRMLGRIENKIKRRSFNIWIPAAGALTAAALVFLLIAYFSPAQNTGLVADYVQGGGESSQSAAAEYVFADNGTF